MEGTVCIEGSRDLTLPHLLADYGYEQNHVPKEKKLRININQGSQSQKEEKSSRKKSKRVTIKDKHQHKKSEKWIDEREVEKMKLQIEHNLEVYYNTYSTRDEYMEQYTDALREKIDKQKAKIDLSTQYMEHLEKYRKAKKAYQARRMIKKKMVKQVLSHNDAFIKQLQKSRYYSIVGLLDKMKLAGAIRTQADEDQFWEDIEGQSSLLYKESSSKSDPSVPTESESQTTAAEPSLVPETRVLTQITESGESISRPTTRHTGWQPSSKSRNLDPDAISRQAAQALERRCPQPEMPDLACYTLNLDKPEPDPKEIAAHISAKKRDKERKIFIRKLRQMYNISQSNKAQTKRILIKRGEEDIFTPPDVKDLTGYIDLDDKLSSCSEDSTDEVYHAPRNILGWRRSIMPIMEIQELSTDRSDQDDGKNSPSPSRNESQTPALPPIHDAKSEREMPKYLPFSMTNVFEKEATMDAKCLSTLWKNYT